MSEPESWTEDVCTCGHPVSAHKDGDGRCQKCDENRSYGSLKPACLRFQWNEQPRRRTW